MLKRFCARPSLLGAIFLRSYATRMYTDSHEWVAHEGGEATVGVSDYAQENLGDVVYVSMPQVGDKVAAREVIGEIESIKATSSVYSPVDGTVSAVNETLMNEPDLVNKSPEEKGWLVKLKCDELPEGLMNIEEYQAFIKE
ncbi:unnamed protein product [Phytomonas sp. EM1]|nr:unnamed protein product [Phytomonas sp. EM1]|eukprot:CCW64375.1 unnamed protein product [Phytomonas sp. isolate EM1]